MSAAFFVIKAYVLSHASGNLRHCGFSRNHLFVFAEKPYRHFDTVSFFVPLQINIQSIYPWVSHYKLIAEVFTMSKIFLLHPLRNQIKVLLLHSI